MLNRMSWEGVQIRLNDVFNIMKSIQHRSLEGSTNIFETEREIFIRKRPPWTNERSFVLING